MGTQAPGQTPPNQSNIQASGMLGGSGIPTPGAIAQPQPMQTGGSPAQGGKPGGAPSGQNNGINPQSGLPWGQHPGMGGAGNPLAPPTPDRFANVPQGYRPDQATQQPMVGGFDANSMVSQRPGGFDEQLKTLAAQSIPTPMAKSAQSYGASIPTPPPRKKGGK